jgi:hypothetical protein
MFNSYIMMVALKNGTQSSLKFKKYLIHILRVTDPNTFTKCCSLEYKTEYPSLAAQQYLKYLKDRYTSHTELPFLHPL